MSTTTPAPPATRGPEPRRRDRSRRRQPSWPAVIGSARAADLARSLADRTPLAPVTAAVLRLAVEDRAPVDTTVWDRLDAGELVEVDLDVNERRALWHLAVAGDQPDPTTADRLVRKLTAPR